MRHLGPAMAERDVEVFLGTLERPDERMAEAVIEDEVAGPYIAGVVSTFTNHEARHAELAAGEGDPRVYAVEPSGAFEDDPNVIRRM